MTPPSEGAPGEFSARGDIVLQDLNGVNAPRRATFDDWRVRGPTASLTRTDDSTWAGKLRGRQVTLRTAPGKIAGGDVDLDVAFNDKGAIVVDGKWGGRIVHLELETRRVAGVFPGGQFEMTEMGNGMFNSYGMLLQIRGPPDMPQVVLSLLDVFVP